MLGFEKIAEEKIRKAQREGQFDNLSGAGKPLVFEDDRFIPEDLRMAYKILKNADCLPPELEVKKEIRKTEELLADMEDTEEKYRALKKLNVLIMKYNIFRDGSLRMEIPQHYQENLVERFGKKK